MLLYSIVSFHSFIPYLSCSLKSSKASFIFFHHLLLSHQALISPIFLISPHLSSSHLPAKPKPSPSPAPVPAVAIASSSPSPSPAHRRRHRSTMLSQALKPLIFFSSSQALISLRHCRRPSRRRRHRQPTLVASPLQVSALSSFLVNFLIVVLA